MYIFQFNFLPFQLSASVEQSTPISLSLPPRPQPITNNNQHFLPHQPSQPSAKMQQKATSGSSTSLSITTLSMPSKTRLGLQRHGDVAPQSGSPNNAKLTMMHRHSSSEHNNNMLPFAKALLICIPTSIQSTSADHSYQKYWQQAASIASRATHKLLPYASLQIQLHQANGLGHRPNHHSKIIDVVGMLSHPSFFCVCWHHTGDV